MPYQFPPPIRERFLDDFGYVSRPWKKWFDSLKILDDQQTKKLSVTHTAGATLTRDDFGRIIKFNIGDRVSLGHAVCKLPSISETDINGWLKIFKIGSKRLTIQAADSDIIEISSPGGYIFCDEMIRGVANIELYVSDATTWAILSGTGIWKVC